MNARLNGWSKYILAMLVPLLGAAVAFGVVQSEAGRNHEAIDELRDTKADRIVVELQQRQLDRIESKLDRLLGKH